MSVKLTDNSKEVLSAFEKQMQNGLNAIGITAQKYAMKDANVDTGRARNSITYATSTSQGQANSDPKSKAGSKQQLALPEDYAMHGIPKDTEVIIGSNVEYFRRSVEDKTHCLRNAAAQHGNEYKKLMETALKS